MEARIRSCLARAWWPRYGSIVNDAHPATPVVIGDLEIMKGWPGDVDGSDEGDLLAVERGKTKGNVYLPDFAAHPPTVFRRGSDEVWLLASEEANGDLRDEYTEKELLKAVSATFPEPEDRVVIDVPSGAVAIALAHETISAKAKAASKPLYTKTLVIVPVDPGAYEITTTQEDDEAWMRARLRKVSAAALAAFEKEYAARDDDDDDATADASPPKPGGPLDETVLTKDPKSVQSLVVQTQWPAMFAHGHGGTSGGRIRVPSRGEIPDVFAKLSNLEILHVEGELGGRLPTSVGECTKLQELKLDVWKSPTELPASLAKLTNLVELIRTSRASATFRARPVRSAAMARSSPSTAAKTSSS